MACDINPTWCLQSVLLLCILTWVIAGVVFAALSIIQVWSAVAWVLCALAARSFTIAQSLLRRLYLCVSIGLRRGKPDHVSVDVKAAVIQPRQGTWSIVSLAHLSAHRSPQVSRWARDHLRRVVAGEV
eukprot:648420-Amphidinium_carterae.1